MWCKLLGCCFRLCIFLAAEFLFVYIVFLSICFCLLWRINVFTVLKVPVADNKTTFRADHVTSMIIFDQDCLRVIRTWQWCHFDPNRSTCFTDNTKCRLKTQRLKVSGAMEPYGITKCYLPQVNVPYLNPNHAGRYSIYLSWRDWELSWSWCWLYAEMVYLSTDSHPSR